MEVQLRKPTTRTIGALTASMLLCAAIAPGVAMADETAPAAEDQAAIAQLVGDTTADTASDAASDASDDTAAVADALNDSADTDERLQASSDETTPTAVADKSALNALIDATRDDDLKPLASGYRADDSGTAPYDSWKANADDLDKLHAAREAAQAVAADEQADADQVSAAADALRSAF